MKSGLIELNKLISAGANVIDSDVTHLGVAVAGLLGSPDFTERLMRLEQQLSHNREVDFIREHHSIHSRASENTDI